MTIKTILKEIEERLFAADVSAKIIGDVVKTTNTQFSTLLDEIEKEIKSKRIEKLPEYIKMGDYPDIESKGYNRAIDEFLSTLNKYRV